APGRARRWQSPAVGLPTRPATDRRAAGLAQLSSSQFLQERAGPRQQVLAAGRIPDPGGAIGHRLDALAQPRRLHELQPASDLLLRSLEFASQFLRIDLLRPGGA